MSIRFRKLFKKHLSLLAIFLFLYLSGPLHATEKLRINTTIHSPLEQFFIALLEEVALVNHVTIERQTPPIGRSLSNTHQGIDDGEGPRVAGLENTFENLVRVLESFGGFNFVAFAKNQDIRTPSWESLKPYNVAYIQGWKIFDSQVQQARSITKVRNIEQLFNLLARDRTEIILITRSAGLNAIKKMGLTGINSLEPPLVVKPMYLYLHKKHSALVPKFAKNLRQLKSNGTYQRIKQDVLGLQLSAPNH